MNGWTISSAILVIALIAVIVMQLGKRCPDKQQPNVLIDYKKEADSLKIVLEDHKTRMIVQGLEIGYLRSYRDSMTITEIPKFSDLPDSVIQGKIQKVRDEK